MRCERVTKPLVRSGVAVITLVVMCASLFAGGAQAAAGRSGSHGPTSKSHLVQDPKWLAAKMAGQVHVVNGQPRIGAAPNVSLPSSYQLGTGVTYLTVEPPSVGTDSNGKYYTDGNFVKFCAEGASTVAMYYWGANINGGQGSFTDPSNNVTTSWGYWLNRYYLMYLAMDTWPPSFGTPGEFDFSSGTTNQPDIRDTLNWEASGHNRSNWSTWYYAQAFAWNDAYNPSYVAISQSSFHGDLAWDIGYDHEAVVVTVNAHGLPSWPSGNIYSNPGLSHSIAIVGYDDVAGTYSYIETCGGSGDNSNCGSLGSSYAHGGVYTISQTALYNDFTNNSFWTGSRWGQTGAIIW